MKTDKTKFIFITFLLFFLSISEINTSFSCGADKLKIKPFNLDSPEDYEKRRLASGYTPIKIGVDFSSFTKPSSLSDYEFQNIRNLISETMNEFPKFLSIQHTDITIDDKDINTVIEYCELNKVSSNYRRFLINYDVVVFPAFENLGSGVLAAAGACLTYGKNRPRPVFGILYINPELSFDIRNTDIYMKNLLLHEVTHILMFNPSIFNALNLVSGSKIISTNAVLKARQHFNCGTLSGIPLENQGGEGSVGSHWEARYMLGDYMISTDYIDTALSDITLGLFEDTGYYKVNYYSGGLFKYGKNKGCDFINKKCVNSGKPISEEFCVSGRAKTCSATRTMKSICVIYDYSASGISIPSNYQYFSNPNYGGFQPANFCPVPNINYENDDDYYPNSCKVGTSTLNSDYGETIGDTSFCFISSLVPRDSQINNSEQAICYETKCDDNNKQIIVSIGELKVTCPTSGGVIDNPSGFKGSINCPKYIDICDFEDNVMCNEMFDCLNKKVETDYDSYNFDPDDDNFIRYTPEITMRSSSFSLKINIIFIFLLYFLALFYN